MKIGPNLPDGLRVEGRTVAPDRVPTDRAGSVSDPVSGPPPVDKVSLSSQTPAFVGASGEVPFDQSKVDEVRRAIAEGRFPVDARKVADRLLADARELLGLAPEPR